MEGKGFALKVGVDIVSITIRITGGLLRGVHCIDDAATYTGEGMVEDGQDLVLFRTLFFGQCTAARLFCWS